MYPKLKTSPVLLWGTYTLLATSAILALVTAYHAFVLPRPAEDRVAGEKSGGEILREFGEAFRSFFTKPGIGLLVCFLLLYRLPEALSVKLLYPFFSDAVPAGGLGKRVSVPRPTSRGWIICALSTRYWGTPRRP